LLFALGMVGLHARLERRSGPLGTIDVLLAWIVVGTSVVNLIGLALPIPTPGEPDASILLRITYMVAFLGILVGLLGLGIAALRARVMPSHQNAAPLAVGVLWFPLLSIEFVISDGVGSFWGPRLGLVGTCRLAGERYSRPADLAREVPLLEPSSRRSSQNYSSTYSGE
jgi:hypothetical protein